MAEEKKRVIIAEPIPENVLIEAGKDFPDAEEDECTTAFQLHEKAEEVPETGSLQTDEYSAVAAIETAELFKKCILPDKTELQERILKTRNDILVGRSLRHRIRSLRQ